jgi:hypothetical protein
LNIIGIEVNEHEVAKLAIGLPKLNYWQQLQPIYNGNQINLSKN